MAKQYRKTYTLDRGVDLLNDALNVDDRRSPLCKNMIRGKGGVIEKRIGWRVMKQFDGRINGMAFCRLQRHYGEETADYLSFLDVILVHSGKKLYAATVTPRLRTVLGEDKELLLTDSYGVAAHAAWILRYIAGLEPDATDWQIRNADENGDGIVDKDDADLLLKYTVRLVASNEIAVQDLNVAVEDSLSHIFSHEGAAYFMDGQNYLRITLHENNAAFEVVPVRSVSYIPTTSISAFYLFPEITDGSEPNFTAEDGEWQDGEQYEEANILNPKRINTMCGDGLNTVFWLDMAGGNIEKIEIYATEDGANAWRELSAAEYTVAEDGVRERTKITFQSAPLAHPVSAGLANIKVTFSVGAAESVTAAYVGSRTIKTPDIIDILSVRVDGVQLPASQYSFSNNVLTISNGVTLTTDSAITYTYAPRTPVERCRFATKYGYYNDNRWFASGNSLLPNRDWMSGTEDPTYWPEHGWTDIGATSSPIMTYVHYGEALGIIKADDKQDAGVYVRTAAATDEGNVLFPVQQGVPGIGAASTRCAANLSEDAVFAAKEGVYAIRIQDISKTTAVVPRAEFVAASLKNEDLSQCVSAVWNGLYVLAVGKGRCYVADSKQRTGDLDTGFYQYDWYIWENVPARVLMELDGELWFGTEDGRLCKFNTDCAADDYMRYSDAAIKTDAGWQGGTAIHALWATKRDGFDSTAISKRLAYNGLTVVCARYAHSSLKVYYIADGVLKAVKEEVMDAEQADDLTDIHIETISDAAHFDFRLGNFNTLQFVFENNVIGEGMGINSVEIKYCYGNDYRGR